MKLFISMVLGLILSSWADSKVELEKEEVLLGLDENFPSFMLKPIKGRYLSSKKIIRKSQQDSTEAIVFSYWSISCIPCRSEMKALQSWQIKKPNVKLIFINVDETKSKKMVYNFASEYLDEDVVLLDPYQKSAEKAKVCSQGSCTLPSLYMTDESGKIIFRQQGNVSSTELIESLEKSL